MSLHCRSVAMAAEQNQKPIVKVAAAEHFSDNSFLKICDLFKNQKLILTALQPINRSFSQPELRSDLICDFKSFRDLLLGHPLKKQHNESATPYCTCSQRSDKVSVGYEVLDEDSDQSTPPIPKPRKSVQRRRQGSKDPKKENAPSSESGSSTISDDVQTPLPHNNLDEKVHLEATATNSHAPQESNSQMPLPESSVCSGSGDSRPEVNGSLFIATEQAILLPSHLSHSTPTRTEAIKVKAKHSFRQFLKINKYASNKFLSIRLSKEGLYRKKSLFSWNTETEPYKPRRPTRIPPPPPILIFRAPAPSPVGINSDQTEIESNESKCSTMGAAHKSMLSETNCASNSKECFDGDDISELYHDAFNAEDLDDIYSSVDETVPQTTEPDERVRAIGKSLYQIVDELWRENGTDNQSEPHYDETREEGEDGEENYYDDGECIYEEVSSNDGTIYEEFLDEENLYDNAEAVALGGKAEDEKKQIKRLKKMQKIMKRFHLNGDEIPVNAGMIKRDAKGTKSDLMVRQGETVLILRIEKCPPGKWLAKNERSKIGYVDLDNVYFDTESIKTVIRGFHNI